jgi:hypothetical protein
MTHFTAADLGWTALLLAGFAVFWLPVGIAAVRRIEKPGLVVLFTLLGLATGFMWFAALLAACILPRRVTPASWPGGPAFVRPPGGPAR